MNFEGSSRLQLSDDGELLDGKFCAHCGQISSRDGMFCEHCGNPFPIPTTALRLRLEALRQSKGKKIVFVGSERKIQGLFHKAVLALMLGFVVVIFAEL